MMALDAPTPMQRKARGSQNSENGVILTCCS